MGSRQRRLGVALALVLVVLMAAAGVLLSSPGQRPGGSARPVQDRVAVQVDEATRAARAPSDSRRSGPASDPAAAAHAGERARREQVRAAILAAARAREAAAGPAGPAADPLAAEPPPAAPTGELTKRIEGHEELFAELNRDFMPLADECIEQAQTRAPELAGMLAVGVDIVVDEELGAVIERVDFGEQNEVEEPELRSCVRESLLSMLLPPGSADGREQLMLTMPLEPLEPPL